MEKIIERDGVRYELVKIDSGANMDCGFCDIGRSGDTCSFLDRCKVNHCYKRIKENNMKKSELSFKCVVPDAQDEQRLRFALLAKGYSMTYVNPGRAFEEPLLSFRECKLFANNAKAFDYEKCPLVTYEQALDLIAQVEKPEPVPEFDIKPFDRVLARDRIHGNWYAKHFSQTIPKDSRFLETGGCYCNQLIKYEGNEHLHGTTDKPDGWWECKDGKPLWVKKNE